MDDTIFFLIVAICLWAIGHALTVRTDERKQRRGGLPEPLFGREKKKNKIFIRSEPPDRTSVTTYGHARIGFADVHDGRVKLFLLPESVGYHATGQQQANGHSRGARHFSGCRSRGRTHGAVRTRKRSDEVRAREIFP